MTPNISFRGEFVFPFAEVRCTNWWSGCTGHIPSCSSRIADETQWAALFWPSDQPRRKLLNAWFSSQGLVTFYALCPSTSPICWEHCWGGLFIFFKFILKVESKQQKDETKRRFYFLSCFQPTCEFPGLSEELSRPNAPAVLGVLGSLLWFFFLAWFMTLSLI